MAQDLRVLQRAPWFVPGAAAFSATAMRRVVGTHPALPKVQVDELPTLPLSTEEYQRLLDAVHIFADPCGNSVPGHSSS